MQNYGISNKTAIKLQMAVDEIYSNICYYGGAREVTLRVEVEQGTVSKEREWIMWNIHMKTDEIVW